MQSSSQIVTTNKPTCSFLQAGCPSCRPTNSVRALMGKLPHISRVEKLGCIHYMQLCTVVQCQLQPDLEAMMLNSSVQPLPVTTFSLGYSFSGGTRSVKPNLPKMLVVPSGLPFMSPKQQHQRMAEELRKILVNTG